MIILLGATGYVGKAFARMLASRGHEFIAPTRSQLDYTRFGPILRLLREQRPTFLINAAGFTGKPNVDACERARAETLQGNVLFPQMLAHACGLAGVPWGHVSSGCIYSGAKLRRDGALETEKDLMLPGIRHEVERDRDQVQGYAETDPPNFSFREGPCSFYSGTKALGEEAIADAEQCYVWRLRVPFDEFDNPRNYLTKLQTYPKVYDNYNSLSHRSDFVNACFDLWERRAPAGLYNVTNPGYVSTRQVVERISRLGTPGRPFEFWADDAEFYAWGAQTPRSNCVLDVTKLLATGVKMRPVDEAIDAALRSWTCS